ncbi:uncharacterized protein LOC129734396 [Falco cherrug]|uniref:uncharacterized protein LOC129734396 n=1 Tax=Falco cherrug TaxID=345164 RepID=UPI00247B2571|nr:uncharacterized protein LOC129734396 [Falco cherrug]
MEVAEPWLAGARAVGTGWVQPLALSTLPVSIAVPVCSVRGPGEADAPSRMSPGVGSGLCLCLGSSGLGAAPGEALVPTENHLHPSLCLLHPHLLSIGSHWVPSWEALGCLVVFEHCRARQHVPAGWGRARLPSQRPWPRGSGCLRPSRPCTPAPCALPGPGLGRMIRDFPVPAPAKLRALAAKRAGAVPQPCQDHPQVTPGVPDGEAEGAGTRCGSCHVCHGHVDVSPLAHGACGVFCTGAGGVWGSGAGAVGVPDTRPSPMDTHAVPVTALGSPAGAARWSRSPSLLPWAPHRESQVQHVTNLICSSC